MCFGTVDILLRKRRLPSLFGFLHGPKCYNTLITTKHELLLHTECLGLFHHCTKVVGLFPGLRSFCVPWVLCRLPSTGKNMHVRCECECEWLLVSLWPCHDLETLPGSHTAFELKIHHANVPKTNTIILIIYYFGVQKNKKFKILPHSNY